MARARVTNQLDTACAAYIAGLVDGEGTITLSRIHRNERRRLVVCISNNELPILRFVLAAIGDLVAPQGAIVSIVGSRNPLAQDAVRAKSATLCWELMFTRPRFQTPDMIEQHRLLDRVADWLDSGRLRGTLRETLSPINAANLRAAHARLEAGTMIGKLVLSGWS